MGRRLILLGRLARGFAMWVVGFIFWGTPLGLIALSRTDDAASAAIQQLGPASRAARHRCLCHPVAGLRRHPALRPGADGDGPFFNSNGFAIPDTQAR
jgi:hypothetical protein